MSVPFNSTSVIASELVTASDKSRPSYFGIVDVGLIFAGLVWGSSNVVTKSVYNQWSPGAFIVLRFVLASVFLLPFASIIDGGLKIQRSDWKPMLILAILGVGVVQPLFLYGLAYTSAANLALIFAASTAFLALLNQWVYHEKLSRRGWMGIGMAFLGIGLIVGSGSGLDIHSHTLLGNLLALLGMVFWALYAFLAGPLMKRYSPLRVTALSISIGTIPLIFVGMPGFLSQDWGKINGNGWLGLLYSSLFGVVVSYILWNLGIKKIGGVRTAIYQNLSPVTTAILSAIFLAESFTPLKIAGTLLILCGLYMVRIFDH